MIRSNVQELIDQLSRAHIFNSLHWGVAMVLHEVGVIADVHKVKAKLIARNSPMTSAGFTVEKQDNIYHKKIDLLIRPDSRSSHRSLTLIIQIGTDIVFHTEEDKDKGKTTKRTFNDERRAILRDIRDFFKSYSAGRAA